MGVSDKSTMERDKVDGGGKSSPDQDAIIEVSPPTLDEDNISTLSYLINLQDTKLEHENEEETYLNEETAQLITDKYEERLKLESLGKLLPINTPTEPVIFNIAMQRAVAFPVPIRRKKAETKLIGRSKVGFDQKLSRSKVGSANSDTGPESDFTGNGCTSDWEWSRARSHFNCHRCK